MLYTLYRNNCPTMSKRIRIYSGSVKVLEEIPICRIPECTAQSPGKMASWVSTDWRQRVPHSNATNWPLTAQLSEGD
jgi:hypothetical protein